MIGPETKAATNPRLRHLGPRARASNEDHASRKFKATRIDVEHNEELSRSLPEAQGGPSATSFREANLENLHRSSRFTLLRRVPVRPLPNLIISIAFFASSELDYVRMGEGCPNWATFHRFLNYSDTLSNNFNEHRFVLVERRERNESFDLFQRTENTLYGSKGGTGCLIWAVTLPQESVEFRM